MKDIGLQLGFCYVSISSNIEANGHSQAQIIIQTELPCPKSFWNDIHFAQGEVAQW